MPDQLVPRGAPFSANSHWFGIVAGKVGVQAQGQADAGQSGIDSAEDYSDSVAIWQINFYRKAIFNKGSWREIAKVDFTRIAVRRPIRITP